MFSLENSFIRILFAVIIQIVCLVTAIFGIVYAGEHGKWAGSIRFLSQLAISFAWLVLGTVILPRFNFCHSLSGLAVYTTWGTLGIVPFVFSLLKVQQKENPFNRYDAILGIITVLLFCGALAVLLYYQCVTNGVLIADKLFLEDSLNAICCFFLLPVILFFTPIFSLSALISGALREKFSGFLKNLLLLAVAPAGLLLFVLMVYYQLDKFQSGCLVIYAVVAIWIICMIIPYAVMLWYSKKEKDDLKFLNGISGVWSVIFFLLLLGIFAYLGQNS